MNWAVFDTVLASIVMGLLCALGFNILLLLTFILVAVRSVLEDWWEAGG